MMKIKYYPCQPHCFAYGGFEIQMLSALDAVQKCGVAAEKLDHWSRDDDFDIMHIWGVGQHNYNVIRWAKNANKKIVASVLLPYYETSRAKLGFHARYFSHISKELRHHFGLLDVVTVVNDIQAEILEKYYKVKSDKIKVVPNIVHDAYFKKPTLNFYEKYSIKDYLLCTGNICERKNQLNLVKACLSLNQNLVIIGNGLDGENEYGKEIETLINNKKNIIWIKGLQYASEDLIAAYYGCKCFALISHSETQPISALEAVAANKALLMLDKKYAYQNYYKGAYLCKSTSVKDIVACMQKQLLQTPNTYDFNQYILECRSDRVGVKYKEVYLSLR